MAETYPGFDSNGAYSLCQAVCCALKSLTHAAQRFFSSAAFCLEACEATAIQDIVEVLLVLWL
jgi:hypothetical protein